MRVVRAKLVDSQIVIVLDSETEARRIAGDKLQVIHAVDEWWVCLVQTPTLPTVR